MLLRLPIANMRHMRQMTYMLPRMLLCRSDLRLSLHPAHLSLRILPHHPPNHIHHPIAHVISRALSKVMEPTPVERTVVYKSEALECFSTLRA